MEYLWRLDEFDSKVFGFKVAKIVKLKPKQVKNLVADLIKNKVVYATIRVQFDNFQLIDELELCGFLLVDGIISFSLDISLIEPSAESGMKLHGLSSMVSSPPSEENPPKPRLSERRRIREAKSSDFLQLKKLTTNLYSGTRITNDPRVKAFSNKYYITWVENSVKGEAADSVLVWEEPHFAKASRGKEGEILGYITLQKKGRRLGEASGQEGQIPLIGVSPKARGRGIAKKLISAALSKFKKWGVKEVFIETQMGNIPALRAYQSSGFKIVNSYLTFRWAR